MSFMVWPARCEERLCPFPPVEVIRQGPGVADFLPDAFDGGFGGALRYLPEQEAVAHFVSAPALLFDPADRRIISIIRVVEKVQLLQPVEGGFNLRGVCMRGELVAQLSPAVSAPGQEGAGPVHETAQGVRLVH